MTASDLTRARLLHCERGAVLSPCNTWRYWLHRRWTFGLGWTVFIMLNPSTADAEQDDPTIRRCIDFAKTFGSEGLIVVNLFAARATNPSDLCNCADPEGPENHAYVLKACELAGQTEPDHETGKFIRPGKLICAWGANDNIIGQDRTVMGWVDASGAKPLCLGHTKSGAPRHPLYVPKATAPQPFELRRAAA